MKKRCQEAGFEIKEFDGHAFSASIGKGERIDIVSHLDVVEPGNDWTSDPFTPVNTQSYIRARGSQDMKSGAWLSFLALKTLKEQNIELNKTFTLVYGTDEEKKLISKSKYKELLLLDNHDHFNITKTNIVSKTNGKIKSIKVAENEMVSDKQLLMTLE